MSEIQVRDNPRDFVLSRKLYEVAYKREMSMSALLEEMDPSGQYINDPVLKGTDAFERQLYFSGVAVRSNIRAGVWADKVEKFWTADRDGTAALLPEYVARVWRKTVSDGWSVDQGQRFYASSDPVSDVMYPAYIQATARQKMIAPAIPLALLVAITTPIDSGVYKSFYLTDDETERRMVRVGEGATVPTVKLTGGDHSIDVRKYGRCLEGSYETFRRMRIDRFALHIALLAVQTEVDKVKTGIDVLINGDGNASTSATSYNKTTLDTGIAAGDPISAKAYLAWLMKWGNPYNCQVILAQESNALDLFLVNAGSANVLLGQLNGIYGMGGLRPVSDQMGYKLVGWESQVTANTLLGVDTRFALEMVQEIGASLTETDMIISQQFRQIVMTESVGFCVMDQNASKLMVTNA